LFFCFFVFFFLNIYIHVYNNLINYLFPKFDDVFIMNIYKILYMVKINVYSL